MMLDRRTFGRGLLAAAVAPLAARWAAATAPTVGGFAPWSPGVLDIHHIDSGRGNATFILAPDGTTLLIDCGASNDGPDVSAPARPDGSRRPGEWVAAYALREARAAGRDALDYLIVTHIHPDHIGDVGPPATAVMNGSYQLTGVCDVDRLMPAKVVLDRSYPGYGPLPPLAARFTSNYLAWLDERRRTGREVARLDVGSDRQITLRSASRYPHFAVRALAGNGRIWNGTGTDSHTLFPDVATLAADERPTENMLSLALRLSYGRFRYFTGGDLIADTRDGRFPWMDVETPVARVAGRVEVAVANHHGYFDSCGPDFVRLLDAQAYVIPSWHVTHPGQAQLQRLLGAWPGVARHDVFATDLLPANRQLNERFVKQMRSTQGHVVVRVAPGGDSYDIFVLDSSREVGSVKLKRGPYLCRS
jgi:metallo-beta-lactamase superfamily protein